MTSVNAILREHSEPRECWACEERATETRVVQGIRRDLCEPCADECDERAASDREARSER